MNNFLNKLKNRVDFKFYNVSILPLIMLILTYPAIKWLPIQYAYENSLLEYFQLIILLITFVFCLKAKNDKVFFNSMALVVMIIFLREINCGRTVFFPIEGMENAFYSWKEIKYGYLAHPIYGIFMGLSFLYFILSKAYKILFKYIKRAYISFYNWCFLFIGIVFGTVGEKMGNFILEEMMESIFYLSLFAIIYLQAYNMEYIENTEI